MKNAQTAISIHISYFIFHTCQHPLYVFAISSMWSRLFTPRARQTRKAKTVQTGRHSRICHICKGKVLDKLQNSGRTVCYIGDGINDALALRKAAVSISLQDATNLALNTAQVILLKGDLTDLPHLFDLAQQFERDMHRTFGAVIVPHIVGMGAVLFGEMGGVSAIMLSQLGLGLGVGSALLPRLQTKSTETDVK